MTELKENNLVEMIRLLEKRIEELEKVLKKEKDLLLDEYLKVQGFK